MLYINKKIMRESKEEIELKRKVNKKVDRIMNFFILLSLVFIILIIQYMKQVNIDKMYAYLFLFFGLLIIGFFFSYESKLNKKLYSYYYNK